MTRTIEAPEFLRSMTTGKIHAVVDYWNVASGGWAIKSLCGDRDLTGSIVHSTGDRIWRNDDFCRKCGAAMRRFANGR